MNSKTKLAPPTAPTDYFGDPFVFKIDDGERHWYVATDALDALKTHCSLMESSNDFYHIDIVEPSDDLSLHCEDENDTKAFPPELFTVTPPTEGRWRWLVTSTAAGWVEHLAPHAPEQICSSVF